jgi:Asp-tRNA(Asn)/Glu-tRNA(Gln) amidotransferase A subunit family amidase
VPALTVPNEVESGPAVGFQLLGSRFDERTLLRVGRTVAETIGDAG